MTGDEIPVTAAFGSKIYPVRCENQESTLILMKHLHEVLLSTNNPTGYLKTLTEILPKYLDDFKTIVAWLKKAKESSIRVWNYSMTKLNNTNSRCLEEDYVEDIDNRIKQCVIREVAMSGTCKQVKV